MFVPTKLTALTWSALPFKAVLSRFFDGATPVLGNRLKNRF
jgi:hypothetical protein